MLVRDMQEKTHACMHAQRLMQRLKKHMHACCVVDAKVGKNTCMHAQRLMLRGAASLGDGPLLPARLTVRVAPPHKHTTSTSSTSAQVIDKHDFNTFTKISPTPATLNRRPSTTHPHTKHRIVYYCMPHAQELTTTELISVSHNAEYRYLTGISQCRVPVSHNVEYRYLNEE
jgi:hypothetical protein